MGNGSPLRAVEAEFLRLVPDVLKLNGQEADGWLGDREYGLLELRDVLMGEGTPYAVRDGVWRRVVTSARVSQVWMVGAMGLGMPGLRSVAARTTRGLDAHAVEEVEAEVLAGFVQAIRSINPAYARLAYYLRCRAQRAGLAARRRELSRPEPAEHLHDEEHPTRAEGGGHPDLVLAAAVRCGVLTVAEAGLIGETRLGTVDLAEMAARSGVAYKTAAKRRERAEARLVAAIGDGRVCAENATGSGRSRRTTPAGAVILKTASAIVSHLENRAAS